MKPLVENVNYELIPVDVDGKEYWNVRILDAEFAETVLRFGTLTPDIENQQIRFTFDIVYSPDPDISTEHEDLQEYAARLLSAIIPDTMGV